MYKNPTMITIDDKKKMLKKELKKVAKKVSSAHRAAAMLEYGVSDSTQERYLKGNISSVIVAQTLLGFYQKQVA